MADSKGKPALITGAVTFSDAKKELHATTDDQPLAAALLRLYYCLHDAKTAYYAALPPAAGPVVAITSAQWTNWSTSAHADENLMLIEKLEDVDTILVSQ